MTTLEAGRGAEWQGGRADDRHRAVGEEVVGWEGSAESPPGPGEPEMTLAGEGERGCWRLGEPAVGLCVGSLGGGSQQPGKVLAGGTSGKASLKGVRELSRRELPWVGAELKVAGGTCRVGAAFPRLCGWKGLRRASLS